MTPRYIQHKVLMSMLLSGEEHVKPRFYNISSFEEAIELYKPQIEIWACIDGVKELEIVSIQTLDDLHFDKLFMQSGPVIGLMERFNISFKELYKYIDTFSRTDHEKNFNNGLETYIYYKYPQKEKVTIETNFLEAFLKLKLLIQNYLKLHLFCQNLKNNNCHAEIMFLNASAEQLSDLDNTRFIDEIERELANKFDKFDLSEAYTILVIPNELQDDDKKSNEPIYQKYIQICKANNVLFIPDISEDDQPIENQFLYPNNLGCGICTSSKILFSEEKYSFIEYNLGFAFYISSIIISITSNDDIEFGFNSSLNRGIRDTEFTFGLNYKLERSTNYTAKGLQFSINNDTDCEDGLMRIYSHNIDNFHNVVLFVLYKIFANRILNIINMNQPVVNMLLNKERVQVVSKIRQDMMNEFSKFNSIFNLFNDIQLIIINPLENDVAFYIPIEIKLVLTLLKKHNQKESMLYNLIHLTVSNYKRKGDHLDWMNHIKIDIE